MHKQNYFGQADKGFSYRIQKHSFFKLSFFIHSISTNFLQNIIEIFEKWKGTQKTINFLSMPSQVMRWSRVKPLLKFWGCRKECRGEGGRESIEQCPANAKIDTAAAGADFNHEEHIVFKDVDRSNRIWPMNDTYVYELVWPYIIRIYQLLTNSTLGLGELYSTISQCKVLIAATVWNVRAPPFQFHIQRTSLPLD